MQSGEKKAKSILVYYSKFNVGGAERSNLRLMKLLVKHGWNVTLLLKYAGGTMEKELPEDVNVIHLAKNCYADKVFAQTSKVKKMCEMTKIILPFAKQQLQKKMIIEQLKKKDYDVAVIGLQGLVPNLIIKSIKAKVKMLWIRNDLIHCDPTGRVSDNINKYGKDIDVFPCVSGTAYDSFCKKFPELKDKATVFYNVINTEEMRERSKEKCDIEGKYIDALRVITVCRISDKAKGVFRMFNVYKRLRDEGIFFYWLLVGDGDDFDELSRRVKAEGLDDGFILLGRKDNPFPYYKYCDVSATFSYYEGLCGTVNEAKVMGLPVIATEFSGIHEQITSGENGLIVKNNEDAIYMGMKKIILDKQLRDKLTNDILPEVIANDDNKEQMLCDIIEGKKAN